MPSIRANILTTLAARLDDLPNWEGQVRDSQNDTDSSAQVFAIVAPTAEDKGINGANSYSSQYRVSVLLIAHTENADPAQHAGNPYLYMDSLVTLLEGAVHTPDDWGNSPTFCDVAIEGHSPIDPDGDGEISAAVFLLFKYQHKLDDPEQLP